MTTEEIASQLEEIGDEIHELECGEGNLVRTLSRIVDAMTEINNASVKKEKS